MEGLPSLHVDEELESGIGFAAVFAEVEAAEFFLFADADAGDFLQREEDREGGCEGHDADDGRAEELYLERVFRHDGEDADRERAPDAVHQMDGERTDRVVEVEPVEAHDRGDHDDAGDEADDDRRAHAHAVRAGRDADQTGQAAVHGHGEVGVVQHDLAGEHAGDDRGAGGDHGVHEHEADLARIGVQGGRAVETEPAEPEQEDADGHERHVVAHDGHHLAVDVLADARSEQDHAGERGPAADAVHEGGAGEIVEVQGVQPAAAPAPRADDRVHDRHVDGSEDQVAAQLHAFGDRAGHDRGGRRGEHPLEEEVRPVREFAVVVRDRIARGQVQPESGEPEPVVPNPVHTGVHERESADGVRKEPDRRGHGVLEEDVVAVFCAGQAGLHARESEVHQEDQHAACHDPQVVHREHRIIGGRGRRRCALLNCFGCHGHMGDSFRRFLGAGAHANKNEAHQKRCHHLIHND